MRDSAIGLLGELVAATAHAHSARTLVRALAMAMAATAPIVRVELRPPACTATAILRDGEWRAVDGDSRVGGARSIAAGLAVVASAQLPTLFERDEFREALSHVVAAASSHVAVVERVAQRSRRAHVEARELRADLDRIEEHGEIVARSSAMRAVLARAELVARHPTTVLLYGESGSGKEVIAREIHRRSPRAHRPLVQINCGAIPEPLAESELFGHERGAFTGAERAHVGAFERAHRGTLLLDEVGELSIAAQAKLLRVLQERRIRRVGGEGEIAVDVRVIAATNRGLVEMVEQGRFREDLYYRLDVFAIRVPPLRERRGDLGPLVAALTGELSAKLQLPVPALARSVLSRLDAHDWPGNVRELMNTLETAMILGGGSRLELPESFAARPPKAHDRDVREPRLEASVRRAIENALRATGGKIYGANGAAERLGLPPGTLQSKMRKLGIERAAFVSPGTVLRRPSS